MSRVRTSRKQTEGGRSDLVQSAAAYIETHSREKFSLQKMAGALYVNGSYLLRLFKKQMGTTPLVYHNRIRCEHAKKLLRETGLSISEIGEQTGFASSSHFSHVFKKTTGCTPSEYREKEQENF